MHGYITNEKKNITSTVTHDKRLRSQLSTLKINCKDPFQCV